MPPPTGPEDRFTAQPRDLKFVTAGSVKVITQAADAEAGNEKWQAPQPCLLVADRLVVTAAARATVRVRNLCNSVQ